MTAGAAFAGEEGKASCKGADKAAEKTACKGKEAAGCKSVNAIGKEANKCKGEKKEASHCNTAKIKTACKPLLIAKEDEAK